jgi:hypothetical protein
MIRRVLVVLTLAAAFATAQQPDIQQRVAAVRQSIAQNRSKLKQYTWTESTEVSLKGEVKKQEQNECKYGPDGKLVKTPVTETPAGKKKGLRGKIAGNKIEELKDYMDRVGSLMRRYVPPDPETMQAAVKAGHAALDKGTGSLTFTDYAKPGDKVTLSFEPRARKIRSFVVATYLDEPKDVVTLDVQFATLDDGTNYLEQSVLEATAKQIKIKTINFGHTK